MHAHAAVVVAGLVAVIGCAHATSEVQGCDPTGCWSDDPGATNVQDPVQRRATCQRLVGEAAAPPDDLRSCRVFLNHERRARWQASQIVCAHRKIDDRRVEISCEVPVPPSGTPDFVTSSEKSLQLAASAALSSGKNYFMIDGKGAVDERNARSSTPVRCEQTNRGLYALAVGLHAIGESLQPATTTNCSGLGSSVYCSTYVHPTTPLPQPELECSGGNEVTALVAVTTRDTFELLTVAEATIRDNPLLPDERRPVPAKPIARLFEGFK